MSKEETFRENFEKLLELAERTLDYDADGGRSSKNAVMTSALVSYKNVYAKTKSNPIKHIEKFNELYAKCKKAIVDSPTYEDFMEYLDATLQVKDLRAGYTFPCISVIAIVLQNTLLLCLKRTNPI